MRFKTPVSEVRAAVNEGSSFADALAKHPKLFDELYMSMVRAGEVAGNLDEVLTRLSDFLEASQKLKSKVIGAMVYPIIMAVIGAGIMTLLMVMVIPNITDMFKQEGKTLPLNTRFLIWTSDFIGRYLILLLLGTIGAIVGFTAGRDRKRASRCWHKFVLKLPVIGELARTINVGRFARTLGTMLHSGVPMLRALDTAKQIVGERADPARDRRREARGYRGRIAGRDAQEVGPLPAEMIHMTAVGERAGQLEQMLERVAVTYEAEVDTKLTRLTSLLEPLMLVLMGGAVAFIVFSILQPIMDLGQLSGPR